MYVGNKESLQKPSKYNFWTHPDVTFVFLSDVMAYIFNVSCSCTGVIL